MSRRGSPAAARRPGRRLALWRRLAPRTGLHLVAIALLCLAGFGRALSRYFVSEDFVILGQLAKGPFWSTLWQQLAGPFLSLTGGYFYRPLSMVLLLLEQRVWGVHPAGYLWLHLSIHVLNAVLLYRLVGRWTASRGLCWGVTLIFALHPLHPNTVVFIASAATLFCATFVLASLLLYERHRETGAGSSLAAAAVWFGLALGTYEQAVILPLLVAGRGLLLARHPEERRGREVLGDVSVFALVLALYLLARRAAIGTVGLTAWYGDWLRGGEMTRLGATLLESTSRLALPIYGYEASRALVLAVGSLVLATTLWALAGPRRSGRSARLWLFGLSWLIASAAPFGFSPVVPGNGRYWYLASIGLGMMLGAAGLVLIEALRAAGVRLRGDVDEPVVTLILTVIGSIYLALLIHYAGIYATAGELTRRIQSQAVRLPAAETRQAFITGQPALLRGPRGVPVAQVFHWGLADALDRPFRDTRRTVLPLPELEDRALLPLLERPELGAVWRWSDDSQTLARVRLPERVDLPRIESLGTAVSPEGRRLRFRALRGAQHRLVLVTRGGSGLHPAGDWTASADWAEALLPELFLQWMNQLYGGGAYAWIEARQPDGRLAALSRLQVLEPAD